ncbi:ferrochelatase [Colwellia psychrerythraea]|uniref:Ferrochelatase n=1 Tax=Colwellia psychrerythraea TaxID=28229 RepID=A0A099KAQ5_COLPS|nr:ferrochelatase [Colwellia psychrerythraea]KGJ87107.1 Ferrochelatase [Colwellia psychrerythraea]
MKSRFSGRKQNSGNSVEGKKSSTTAVLLTNLGSPDEPTTGAVRRYLREFLSDPRVVEIPRLVWLIILHGIILRIRPAKSAKLYQTIWQDDGAPLITITTAQKVKMAAKIKSHYGDNVIVDFAMRYGNPSIASVLQKFQQQGVDKLVVLPLYPQYAGPTTASTFDAVSKELQKWRYIPSIHFLNTYHNNPFYIQALAETVKEHVSSHGKPERLVLSYHGMPEQFRKWGDPYYDFCQETTLLLKRVLLENNLGFIDDEIIMTFQSRFGKAEWLTPYTDETLENLPKQGIKHVAIMSPAFSADCLETLEELIHENSEVFLEAGGESYHYIAALNDRDDHIDALFDVLAPTLGSPVLK